MTAVTEAGRALDTAREHLIGLRSTEGWWQAEVPAGAGVDAEDLLLREFLGIRTGEDTDETARWIRSRQRADGTWADVDGGPGEPSVTTEAYAALRLAGDPAAAPHMRAAAGFVRSRGGVEASQVFTRTWLAMFGQWSWDRLPAMPPEMIFLPPWFPLNVHDGACWARPTVVPVTVVHAYRPIRPVPFDLTELHAAAAPAPATGVAGLLDRVLHRYQRRPPAALRQAALRRATEWIVARQEPDGSWGAHRAPWMFSLVALSLHGYGLAHPVIRRGIGGLDRLVIRDERGRRTRAYRSPVRDTALAIGALRDAGLPGDHPAVIGAAGWLLAQEATGAGDRPAPGGWARDGGTGHPGTGDTALVILALRRVHHPGVRPAIERGLRRLTGTPAPDGAFTAFDAQVGAHGCTHADDGVHAHDSVHADAYDSSRADAQDGTHPGTHAGAHEGSHADAQDGTYGDGHAGARDGAHGSTPYSAHAGARDRGHAGGRDRGGHDRARDRGCDSARGGVGTSVLRGRLPFGDFGVAAGPPAADVTAFVALALARERHAPDAMRRAVAWLLRAQEADGSWCGRRGGGRVYGIGAVVPALIAAGVRPERTCVRRAVAWLERHQGEDGGWGEDPARMGRGATAASPTSWALLALLATGVRSAAVERGVRWLIEHQRPDGTWDEPRFTEADPPGDLCRNHLYRLVFPISALGRYLDASG